MSGPARHRRQQLPVRERDSISFRIQCQVSVLPQLEHHAFDGIQRCPFVQCELQSLLVEYVLGLLESSARFVDLPVDGAAIEIQLRQVRSRPLRGGDTVEVSDPVGALGSDVVTLIVGERIPPLVVLGGRAVFRRHRGLHRSLITAEIGCLAYVGAAVVGDRILRGRSHDPGRVLFDVRSATDDFADAVEEFGFQSLTVRGFGVGLIRWSLESPSVPERVVVAHCEVVCESERRDVGERPLQCGDGIFGVVGEPLDSPGLRCRVGQAVYDGIERTAGLLAGLPYPTVDEFEASELIAQFDQGAGSAGEGAAEPLEPRRVSVVDSPDVNHAVKVPAYCPPDRVLGSP